MMRKQKHLYAHLCWLVVSLLLPFTLQAQSLHTADSPGETVGSGLTVHNSIVWGNVFESAEPSDGSHNLVGEDPMFVSATDFFLLIGSPAIEMGDKEKNTSLNSDIAGVPHVPGKINIGAYENGVEYIVTIKTPLAQEGTLSVYQGTTLVNDGDEFYAGTELRISVIPAEGYRLDRLTANGVSIVNGDAYILTTATTFDVELKQGNGRPVAYATAKSGSGKFNMYNNIIYDNADDYGNYSLDNTNVIANPEFASDTEFTLKPVSPALGKGDGMKLPIESFDLAGVGIAASGTSTPVDAGAYQIADCKLSWDVGPISTAGLLKIFYLVENEDKQKIPVVATNNGGGYPATTIVIRVTPAAGYVLQEIKANDKVLTVTNGETSFELSVNTDITATFRLFAGDDAKATVYQPKNATLKFKNNIVHGNITVVEEGPDKKNGLFPDGPPVAANIADGQNHLDGVYPMFYSVTDFRLKSGSPVIDKGDNDAIRAFATIDLSGDERIYNNETVDFGAYEAKEGVFYIVTFGWTDLKDKDGKVYATVTVTADGNKIISGDRVAAGSEINIEHHILNEEKYEWSGQIGLTGVGTDYLPVGVVTFTLVEDTNISVPIHLRRHVVNYQSTNGSVKITHGSTLISNGEKVSHETILTIEVTPDDYHKLSFVSVNGVHIQRAEEAGGYIVPIREATSIILNCVPVCELDEDGKPVLKDKNGDVDDPGNWEPAELKGLVVWDVQNAVIKVTEKIGGQIVSSGDQLAPGTVVKVTVTPTDANYGITQFQVRGLDMDMKKISSFEVEVPYIEDGKVKPTFIVIRYGEGGWKPGQPNPGPSDPITNYTLTVKALPEGVTMDPQPGIYTVAQGSSRLFSITVDEEIAANYVYLMVNDEAVLIHNPAEPGTDYTYMLIGIYRDTEVSVIVREDPDPNTDPTGNTQVQNDSRIWTGSGMVFIETSKPDRVFIYTMQGRLYTERRITEGETMIHLPAGAYIVVLPENKKTGKIVVSN